MTERKRPVTFREVFAVREYRALYFSLLVNWVGDYLARAAVAVLVYQQSKSVLLSAASFAINFLPWVVGGTVLSALAERYPYRSVLITCDLSRMVLIGLLLVPHLPIPFMLVILFVASLGAPPTQAARSALLPLLMKREQMPMAIATNATTTQSAQVVGYLAGAALATTINPQTALLVDVLTFATSAALIATGVRRRPAARERSKRAHLLRESAEGFRLVFGRETLRSIAVLIFVLTMFAIVPEGLAAAWAAQGHPDATTRGLDQGLIMAAGPIGFVIGGVACGRLAAQEWRDRLVRPLAVASTLILVPAVIGPPPPVAAVLVAFAGIAQGGLTPTLNSKFVLILPHGFRARAYGVMQTGMQLSQFVGVMATGWLADGFRLPLVVGLWSVGGTALMALLVARWPSRQAFQAATDEATASAAAAAGTAGSGAPGATTGAATGAAITGATTGGGGATAGATASAGAATASAAGTGAATAGAAGAATAGAAEAATVGAATGGGAVGSAGADWAGANGAGVAPHEAVPHGAMPHVPRHAAPPSVEAAPPHHGPPRHAADNAPGASVGPVPTSVTPERS